MKLRNGSVGVVMKLPLKQMDEDGRQKETRRATETLRGGKYKERLTFSKNNKTI